MIPHKNRNMNELNALAEQEFEIQQLEDEAFKFSSIAERKRKEADALIAEAKEYKAKAEEFTATPDAEWLRKDAEKLFSDAKKLMEEAEDAEKMAEYIVSAIERAA